MAFANVGRNMQAEVVALDEALGEKLLEESTDKIDWKD
jgi:ribosomal protein L31E